MYCTESITYNQFYIDKLSNHLATLEYAKQIFMRENSCDIIGSYLIKTYFAYKLKCFNKKFKVCINIFIGQGLKTNAKHLKKTIYHVSLRNFTFWWYPVNTFWFVDFKDYLIAKNGVRIFLKFYVN